MKKKLLPFLFILLLGNSLSATAQQKPDNIISGQLIAVSQELRSLPTSFIKSMTEGREFGEGDRANKTVRTPKNNPGAIHKDGALQNSASAGNNRGSALGVTFDGNTQADNTTLGTGLLVPPDPTMAVGPGHIVQMTNIALSVFNKSGTRLSGPVKFSSIAAGASDHGDPIVLYDFVADRWLLLQFDITQFSESLYFCISKTNDPSGAYNVYKFLTPGVFPDYPHIGIWNDSYIVTTHEFNQFANAYLGQGFYAVDRNKMIEGQSTSTLIRFQSPLDGGFLPMSQEGFKLPEAGSPANFFSFDADEYGGTDALQHKTMHIDLANPGNSTLTTNAQLPTTAFDARFPPEDVSLSHIDQQGTAAGLHSVADRMMSRIVYRRFDNYEAVVMNYAVNVSGVEPVDKATYQAAMRWYELRRSSPAAPWVIYQQSTFSPTTINPATGIDRWMGSVNLDQRGSVGLAYSASSSSLFPSLHYAQHYVTDAPGVMGAEQVMYAGTGAQTSGTFRWGDYSSMNIDPADEDQLWFTTEYYPVTVDRGFSTRIGSFKIDPPAIMPEVHFKMGGTAARQKEATIPVPGSACVRYKDYPVTVTLDAAPSASVNITFTMTGTATPGVDYDLIGTTPFTLDAGTLSKDFTVRVYDDAQNEVDEKINISYSIQANGTNATAAAYNQIHTVTIVGKNTDINNVNTVSYGTAQNVYTENFDAIASGLGPYTEETVFLTAGATNPNHFIVGTNGGAGFTNKALYISDNGSDYQYSNTSPAGSRGVIRVTSPAIDITGKGQVTVSFVYKCEGETNNFDYGYFTFSTNGGTSWQQAGSKLQSQTTATTVTITLPNFVENISNLKIGFEWFCDEAVNNQPPLGIDDIVVQAKPMMVAAGIQQAINNATATDINFGPNLLVHYIDPVTNKIMASLTNNSTVNYGCVKMEVDRAGTGAEEFNTINNADKLASKTFKGIPENNGAGSYTVRLYYTEAEIAGWETATGNPRSSLQVIKVNSPNTISSVTPATAGVIPYVQEPATLGTFGTDGVTVEATFAAGGFSGFGIGNPQVVLPITLLEFKGRQVAGTGNLLEWKLSNQLNVKHYEIESSINGITFGIIGLQNAKPYSGGTLQYNFVDRNYDKGTNYYRLKITDNDGSFTYSKIVVITVTDEGYSITAYPNPVTNKLLIDYRGSAKSVRIQITDAQGRMVYDGQKNVERPITLPVENLLAGNYVLRVIDGENVFTSLFIK